MAEILVDERDQILLKRHNWKINNRGYVYFSAVRTILLHREIMQPTHGQVVDHINGDKLDNRRANLRVTSQRINILNNHTPRSDNRSSVPGVCFYKRIGKWQAWISRKLLGNFDTFEDAAKARQIALDAQLNA